MTKLINVECPSHLRFLQPVVVANLRRVGNFSDGGYALTSVALTNSDRFISLGLGENWSFERAIALTNPTAKIDIYDDTVDLKFFATKTLKGIFKVLLRKESKSNLKARFLRLLEYFQFWKLLSNNTHHRIHITKDSFEEILLKCAPKDRIGLKVDIEGSEWHILECISRNQFRFEFIVIEFHELDSHVGELKDFLGELNANFINAHLHANNFASLGSNGFPSVFELTLLKRENAQTSGMYRQRLPVLDLDSPNAKNRADYLIDFS